MRLLARFASNSSILRQFARNFTKMADDISSVQVSSTSSTKNESSKLESKTNIITTLEEFLDKNRSLLNLERAAEEEQNRLLLENRTLNELCNSGVALKKLSLLEHRTGLGGRRLLKFARDSSIFGLDQGRSLPNHKLSPGDIVNLCLSNDHRDSIASGVVAKVSEYSITVAFDRSIGKNREEIDEDDEGEQRSMFRSILTESSGATRKFTLVQAVNDVTFRRLSATLDDLSKYEDGAAGRIFVEYLFGKRELPAIDRATSIENPPSTIDYYFNSHLNEPQRSAVDFCLDDRHPIAIVHGPPGTGKTTVIVEIIRQLVKRGKKVLACAPSNVAVDNLLEKLIDPIDRSKLDRSAASISDHRLDAVADLDVVRLGHPARTYYQLRKYSLDLRLKQREYSSILDDIRREIDQLDRERDRRYANRKRKELRRELIDRERTACRSILQNASVICATLTSITKNGPLGNLLRKKSDGESNVFDTGRKFDVCVIDECGQSTELACWAALLATGGEKCILAGDHRQLPPTIISDEAVRRGFDRSLMARVSEELDPRLIQMLTIQYRMNERIMRWSSENVYDGRLVAGEGVGQRLLSDLPGVQSIEETETPLFLIDTSDCDMNEIVTLDDESKANIGEIRLVYLHVDRLIQAGVPQSSIAIVSPYNLQVHLMRTYINGVYPEVSIRSVDGFQGQERETIVLTLVRSNRKGDVGFLADRRRMNVAATRAKRHLAIVADTRTMKSDGFLRSLMDYMLANGTVKSAMEYEDFSDDYDKIPFSIDIDGLSIANSEKPTASTIVNQESESKTQKSGPIRSNDQSKSKQKKTDPQRSKKFETKGAAVENRKQTTTLVEVDDKSIDWRRELKERLVNFGRDGSMEKLEFESELLAHQRAFVHETAEQMGFEHASENIGDQRRIAVRKKKPIERPATINEEVSNPSSIDRQPIVDQSISAPSLDQPPTIDQSSTKPIVVQKKPKKPKPTASSTKSKLKPTASATIDDDADEKLMEQFAREESRCNYADCHQSIGLVVGEKCRYCIQLFCLRHAMPEVHGCGEAAKRHARMEYERSMGSGGAMGKMTKSNTEKRERLQAKLDGKLKDLKGQRQQQKKPK